MRGSLSIYKRESDTGYSTHRSPFVLGRMKEGGAPADSVTVDDVPSRAENAPYSLPFSPFKSPAI